MFYNPKMFLGMVPVKRIYKDGNLLWRRLNVMTGIVTDESKISIIKLGDDFVRLNIDYETTSHLAAMDYLQQHQSDADAKYELYMGSQVLETTLPTNYTYAGITDIWLFTGGNSLVEIPQGFLAQCTNLRRAAIPTSITTIPAGAYTSCPNLTDIGTIPGNVLEIQGGAMQQLNVEHLVFDNGIQALRSGCFASSTAIVDVTIPSSIQTIEQQAFYGCTGIRYIRISADSTDVTGSEYAPWGAINATVVWNAS